jgi:hypothetical protein
VLCFSEPAKQLPTTLVALVVLYLHTLKQNMLPSYQDSPVVSPHPSSPKSPTPYQPTLVGSTCHTLFLPPSPLPSPFYLLHLPTRRPLPHRRFLLPPPLPPPTADDGAYAVGEPCLLSPPPLTVPCPLPTPASESCIRPPPPQSSGSSPPCRAPPSPC